MSGEAELLRVVSLAVDLIQATTALSVEAGKVSNIIANRIAAGRKEWTQEELDALEADLKTAKSDAHKAVSDLG